jgi:hypothetical protein
LSGCPKRDEDDIDTMMYMKTEKIVEISLLLNNSKYLIFKGIMTKIPRKNGKRVTRRAKMNVKPKKESKSGDAFSESKQKKRPGKMERKNQDSSLSRNSQGVLTMNSAKVLLDQEAKPKTARGQRYLKNNGPQLIEYTKKVLVIKGTKVSQEISNVLRDISLFLKPNCKTFTRKNELFPFEDVNSLEYYGVKNNCSLIAFGSHSKKRPNNLVLVDNL